MKVATKRIKKILINEKGLTQRQVDVFFTVGSGLSNVEASEKLEVNEGTVKFHLTNIFKKLDITSRSQVVLLAHGIEPL